MFYCERCRAGFNAAATSTAMACPRCRAKGIYSPLTLELFKPAAIRGSGRYAPAAPGLTSASSPPLHGLRDRGSPGASGK